MNGSARGTALVVLLVGVPVLACSLVLARRGSAIAVVTWLAAVGFLLYNALMFVFATPVNRLFLLYLAMLSLAVWSAGTLLWHIDVPALGREERSRDAFAAQGGQDRRDRVGVVARRRPPCARGPRPPAWSNSKMTPNCSGMRPRASIARNARSVGLAPLNHRSARLDANAGHRRHGSSQQAAKPVGQRPKSHSAESRHAAIRRRPGRTRSGLTALHAGPDP